MAKAQDTFTAIRELCDPEGKVQQSHDEISGKLPTEPCYQAAFQEAFRFAFGTARGTIGTIRGFRGLRATLLHLKDVTHGTCGLFEELRKSDSRKETFYLTKALIVALLHDHIEDKHVTATEVEAHFKNDVYRKVGIDGGEIVKMLKRLDLNEADPPIDRSDKAKWIKHRETYYDGVLGGDKDDGITLLVKTADLSQNITKPDPGKYFLDFADVLFCRLKEDPSAPVQVLAKKKLSEVVVEQTEKIQKLIAGGKIETPREWFGEPFKVMAGRLGQVLKLDANLKDRFNLAVDRL